jgi:hypothetical protein
VTGEVIGDIPGPYDQVTGEAVGDGWPPNWGDFPDSG